MTTVLTVLGLLAVLLLIILLRHQGSRRGNDHGLLSHRSFYTTWGRDKNPGPRDRIPDELRNDYRDRR